MKKRSVTVLRATNVEVIRITSKRFSDVDTVFRRLSQTNVKRLFTITWFSPHFDVRSFLSVAGYFLKIILSKSARKLRFLPFSYLYTILYLRLQNHVNYVVWTVPSINDVPLFFFHINSLFEPNKTDGRPPPLLSFSRGFSVSKEMALAKAVGECLERIPFLYYKNSEFVVSDELEMKRSGRGYLRPDIISPFSPVQKESLRTLAYSEKTKFRWVKCHGLNTDNANIYGEECMVPAQAFFWNYDFLPNEPRLVCGGTHGMAGWYSESGALETAVCELIERDGFFAHWLLQSRPRKVRMSTITSSRCSELISFFQMSGIHVNILDVSMPDMDYPNFFCVLEGPTNDFGIAAGSGCATNVEAAVYKALEEGASMVHWIRMNRKRYRKPVFEFPYVESYDDWDRLSFWADHENIEYIKNFLSGPEYTFEYFEKKYSCVSGMESRKLINRLVREKGHPIYWLSRQTSAMKELKFFSVKCLIPSLIPTFHDMRQAPLAHPRLEVARKFLTHDGIAVSPTPILNSYPHPFP